VIVALLASAFVALGADPVVDALDAEMNRSLTLDLPEAAPPYFVAYDYFESDHVSIEATLGGILLDSREPNRSLGVAVRVGSPAMDNSNFVQRFQDDGFSRAGLVRADAPDAVRQAAWLTTDQAYKNAVENLARKQATRRNQVERPRPDDFAPGEGHVATAPPGAATDADALAALARELSAGFLTHPQIESSRVVAVAEWGRRVALDSGGTRAQKALAEVDVRVIASARSEDGEELWDHASWTVRSMDQLPGPDVMRAEVSALIQRLEAWRTAPKEQEEYVGPVIFEGDAAVEVFRQLLVPALIGTPPQEVAKEAFGQSEIPDGGMRVKRRVLPIGFDVIDDPLSDPTLASSYPTDDEGVPAQRITLVEDGIVRDLFASRTPGEDVRQSNGHGRGDLGELIRGAPSWTQVTAERALSEAKLVKAGLKIAATYDLDYVLVVRRVADASVAPRQFASFSGTGDDGGSDLSAPVEVVRRYADGHEVRVRGWRFKGIDRRTLRDVVAAGGSTTRTVLQGSRGGVTSGAPTTFTAPAVLFDELELVPIQSAAEKPPRVPSPLATAP
jgi:hypothetical protein